MSISRKHARKVLSNCPTHESFWVNNGPIIKNLNELYRELKLMGEDTFRHHVNDEKNDFSNWITDCLGDHKLATDMRKIKSKEKIIGIVRTRLQYLKRLAG